MITEACAGVTGVSPASYYLTTEAATKRLYALRKRLCAEAVDLGPGGITWLPESDFWHLPQSVQDEIVGWMMTVHGEPL